MSGVAYRSEERKAYGKSDLLYGSEIRKTGRKYQWCSVRTVSVEEKKT